MAKIFKDLLDHDAAVIMSVVEFAEYLTIDGVLLACQFVPSTEKFSNAKSDNYDGLHGDFVTLYFKTKDYIGKRERLPRQSEYVYLEHKNLKKRFEVVSCEEELGVCCLTLASYRQNTLRRIKN